MRKITRENNECRDKKKIKMRLSEKKPEGNKSNIRTLFNFRTYCNSLPLK